jgi:hypothetical protein
MFSSSSRVQISGGNFYDIGGDLNVHNAEAPLSVEGSGEERAAFEFRLNEDPGRQLLGGQRTARRDGRTATYGAAERVFLS